MKLTNLEKALSRKNNYPYLGSITISLKEEPSKRVFGLGYLADTLLDLCALRVKCIIHRTPIINSNPSEDLWSNPVYDIFKKQQNWDKDNGFSAFETYLDELLQISPFLKAIYEHFSDTTIREKGICNRNYDKKLGLVERVEGGDTGFVINYGFTRDKNGLYPFTNEFVKFLESSGKYGKKMAKKLNKDTEEELWKSVKKEKEILPWLNILCQSFIHDRFLKKTSKKILLPAIPRENIDKGIKRLLKAKTPIITVNDRRIDYFKEGDNQSLGFIPIHSKDLLNVHPDIVPVIKAGGKMIGSFMSHKLLHFENKLFYDRWNTGVHDFRKVSIHGGYEAILRKLGYSTNGRNIANLKKILCFQAGFWFTLPVEGGGSKTGNLITFTEHKNKFGKIGSVDIIAGSMMTPEAVYSASKKDGGSLLVPFVDLPEKMVGNPATWGAQAFLQMLVLEYLTMQSREFAKKGSVLITDEKWEHLAMDANIPAGFMKRLRDIQNLFCCPEEGFLEIQANECTFNKKNDRAKAHLMEQGKMREKRSQKPGKKKIK